MKRKCDYCTNELEDHNSTMCDKCIGSFSRIANKMKFNKTNTHPLREDKELNGGKHK